MDSVSAVVLDVSSTSSLMSEANGESGGAGAAGSRPKLLPKGSLTLMQMLLLNAVVCGVEIVACAGFTYIPPMLLKAGYSEENMGFLLGLGPLFGFLFVPVIGRASDRCYSPFGRRRPFILGLSVLLVVSLYLIPFGEYFASLAVGVGAAAQRLGVWGLTAGVVLLDFTTQACLTPCEALLNDASKDSDQNEKIFTVYSLMISSGGILGYLLTAIDWTGTSIGGYFGGQEASIFSILIIVFTMMLAATLLVAQERPLALPPAYDVATVGSNASSKTSTPSIMASTQTSSASSLGGGAAAEKNLSPSKLSGVLGAADEPKLANGSVLTPLESDYDSLSEDNLSLTEIVPATSVDAAEALIAQDARTKSGVMLRRNQDNVVIKRRGGMIPRIVPRCLRRLFRLVPCCPNTRSDQGVLACLLRLGRYLVPQQLVALFQVPVVLRLLAVADFCSWTAIMGFNIYFTDYVGQIAQLVVASLRGQEVAGSKHSRAQSGPILVGSVSV
ncbi:solute carrier family 45 member 3-like [Elysia marginata]|uniref:Solute carrier family 45 member 3-like n=1 Tax=Elysia marginata TaxID=1093978 RepID=A0AAV4ESU4_9GAST|nr:solute carrier family 45 member 3-like [Elysia marginata]